jgi:pyridoxamine 5'-phosphate oxidase
MQYEKNPPFDAADLAADPLAQLDRWLHDAVAAGMIEPTAMTLATVGADARPSARVVLFKGFHDGGLTFYTNYEGHKARELAANPNVALVFWWDQLERQVRVEGRVEKLPASMSENYFHQRPRLSQLAALTSRQSQVVASRAELDARLQQATQAHEGGQVPWPKFWGGYVVRPERVEFWQGRRGRLHDRLQYRRDGGGWVIERLEP